MCFSHNAIVRFVLTSEKIGVILSFQLTLHERGFFNRSKSTILHQGEGPIRTVKWKGCFVAWANDLVRIIDYERQAIWSIKLIQYLVQVFIGLMFQS